MKVIQSENINSFIEIAKSIENEYVLWRFINIKGLPKSLENAISYIKPVLTRTLNPDHITIIALKSGDIFILTKGDLTDITIATEALKTSFQKITLMPEISFLDLSIEWEKFVNIIKAHKIKEKEALQKIENTKSKKSEKLNFKLTPEDLNLFKQKRLSQTSTSILLVDDEPLTLNIIAQSLHDFKTILVETAEDALDLYFSKAPSIVFLDIDMPTYSGYEVLETIKKYDPNAYIIMLSGNSYAEQIKQAITLGAKGFVSKPFSRQKLIEYINKQRLNA